MRDDYTPKPAFDVYARLVSELGEHAPSSKTRMSLRCRRATVTGQGIASVDFYANGRRLARDVTAPFRQRLKRGTKRVTARILYLRATGARITRRARACK
jgi:hypothetical protein